VKAKVMDEVMEALEDDINEVALKIGVLTWVKTKRALENIKNTIPTEIESTVDKFLDDFRIKFISKE